ncbi:MAG: hypothetical protein P4L39_11060 [Humidesulfovibrio sp.]|nr:hypothetical protein [Humidesulfovibrio sp.]
MSRKSSGPSGPADPATSGWRCAADIARSIQRMTLALRNAAHPLMGRGHVGPDPARSVDIPLGAAAEMAGALGWWVLAQGRLLDSEDFAAREAAREDLLADVRRAGVLVAENTWVWDETGRAQLVLATLPTQDRARRVAERLREKGLNIAVRREMPQPA